MGGGGCVCVYMLLLVVPQLSLNLTALEPQSIIQCR
jgi:hypothetical protein